MKYLNHFIIGGFIALSASSCFSERRAIEQLDKIVTRYPDLLKVKSDTVIKNVDFTFNTPKVDIDTLLPMTGNQVSVSKDGVSTTVETVTNADGSKNYRIKTNVPSIPFKGTLRDTVLTNRVEVVTKVKEVVPIWIWLLVGLLIGAILYLLLRNIFKRLTQYLKLPI